MSPATPERIEKFHQLVNAWDTPTTHRFRDSAASTTPLTVPLAVKKKIYRNSTTELAIRSVSQNGSRGIMPCKPTSLAPLVLKFPTRSLGNARDGTRAGVSSQLRKVGRHWF